MELWWSFSPQTPAPSKPGGTSPLGTEVSFNPRGSHTRCASPLWDFAAFVLPPHSQSSQGLGFLIHPALKAQILFSCALPEASILALELRIMGKILSIANLYIRPGFVHKARHLLNGVLGSSFNIILGDFNDKSRKWTTAAVNRHPPYQIFYPPDPSFHGPHGASHLDILISTPLHYLSPTCTHQLSPTSRSGHDVLVWRFERDGLVRGRFHFDPIRVSFFRAAIRLLPLGGSLYLPRLNVSLHFIANCILFTPVKFNFPPPYPAKLRALSTALRVPNLSPLVRSVLDREFWVSRARWQNSRDARRIRKLLPSNPSFWSTVTKKSFTPWTKSAAAWISKSGCAQVVEDCILHHNHGATLSPPPLPAWGSFHDRDIAVQHILNAWDPPVHFNRRNFSSIPFRILSILPHPIRFSFASILLSASPSDIAGINISKRIFLPKKRSVSTPGNSAEDQEILL